MGRRTLPNFERLMKDGSFADLKSVYPYVTAPAWTTIFSGVNPGKHGIFEMFEVRENKVVPSNMRRTDVPLLWDYLTWANKRTLVVGVPFVYPAPKINGVFVSGRFSPRLSCYPAGTEERFNLQGFSYDDLSMEEKTEKILVEGSEHVSARVMESLESRINSISMLIDSERWDVAVIVDGLPDDLLHLSYGNDSVVDEMYGALDRMLGEILKRFNPEKDSLMIFSDHGFCKVQKVLFMNEWLLQKSYTALNIELTTKILMRLGLDWEALSQPGFTAKILRYALEHFPSLARRIENILRSGMIVDEAEQLQRSKVSSFSINEPLAWLRISEKNGNEISRESLVLELEELKKKGFLKNVFETEKIYSGRYVRYAPGEILVEAPEGWAIDTLRWNKRKLTGRPLYTKKGVHRREGILLVYGRELELDSPRVHDIVPTILDMLKLPMPQALDGESLLRKETTREKEQKVVKVLNVAQRLQS